MTPAVVACPATFEMLSSVGSTDTVSCVLSYDAEDPLAVTADFTLGASSSTWTFARSLLRSGMYEPVGEGDVAIRPGLDDEGHATVYLELYSPQGAALLRARSAEIANFLDLTQRVVPIGEEVASLDWDTVVSRLLEPAG